MSGLIPILSLTTLLVVAILALVSKARTEERRHDPYAPVSTLAKDGPYGGVAFLNPTLLPRATPSPAVADYAYSMAAPLPSQAA